MKKSLTGVLLASLLILPACVSQVEADQKMTKGCEAAVGAMISPKQILEVKSTRISDEHMDGTVFRRIDMTALEKDGWIEVDKEYSCVFAQQWGIFRISHVALLEQLYYGNEFLGKKGGKITGSMNDFMKLVKSADTAMGQ